MKMKIESIEKIEYPLQTFSEESANFLFQKIDEMLCRKDILHIALSGGSTPMPILRILKKYPIEWKRLVFFQVDERCVSVVSDESNYKQLMNNFVKHIGSKIYKMYDEKKGIEKSVKEYNKLLHNISFDLVLLGMGTDGHTASLFPETEALKNNNMKACANEVPLLESTRITLTYPTIIEATEIVVLLKGETKVRVLESIEKGMQYPMTKVVNEARKITWLIGK